MAQRFGGTAVTALTTALVPPFLEILGNSGASSFQFSLSSTALNPPPPPRNSLAPIRDETGCQTNYCSLGHTQVSKFQRWQVERRFPGVL